MAIIEDSYISIKYAKNFEWLNSGVPLPGSEEREDDGPGGGGQGGAPSPPN